VCGTAKSIHQVARGLQGAEDLERLGVEGFAGRR
jgi:hypothetical protein